MATVVTLASTTGSLPLDIWICDSCDSTATCVYYDTTNVLPYSFTVPSEYETTAIYAIKVIDNNGCVICETNTQDDYQFQDGDTFEFQDGEIYEFQ